MEIIERGLKNEIADTRGRFMDYIGNPLNGVLGRLELLQDRKFSHSKKKEYPDEISKIWGELFRRLEVFKASGFEPAENITVENIEKLLEFKNRNPLESGVAGEFDNLYGSIVDHADSISRIKSLKK